MNVFKSLEQTIQLGKIVENLHFNWCHLSPSLKQKRPRLISVPEGDV